MARALFSRDVVLSVMAVKAGLRNLRLVISFDAFTRTVVEREHNFAAPGEKNIYIKCVCV